MNETELKQFAGALGEIARRLWEIEGRLSDIEVAVSATDLRTEAIAEALGIVPEGEEDDE